MAKELSCELKNLSEKKGRIESASLLLKVGREKLLKDDFFSSKPISLTHSRPGAAREHVTT